jgi:transcriptional regulator with XRE-family HTH domain
MSAAWFAGRLRELRERAGLTQQELAARVGTTVRNISRLETGVQEATWPTVVALAGVFGVTCDAFLQEPAAMPEPHRGRPRKAQAGGSATGSGGGPKRPQGPGEVEAPPKRRGQGKAVT